MYKNVFFIIIFSLLFANQVFAKNTGILVSIKPLHSLVSAVVGKTDKVSLLIKGSMSPHSFALKPSDTKLLNNSAVFFYIDDQLESALKKTVGGLPNDVNVIKVSTFKNLNLLPVREDVNWEEDGHDHHGHGHDHGSNDIHFWLDPNNAIKIIKGITQKLSSIYPENISAYKTNAKQIIQKIVSNKNDNIPHFGFTMTKKIGSAIVRNKIKRRLKSIIRELLKYKDKYFDLSFNYILICKKEIVKVSYDDLENELMDKFKSNRAS